jgi:hypothetical protein
MRFQINLGAEILKKKNSWELVPEDERNREKPTTAVVMQEESRVVVGRGIKKVQRRFHRSPVQPAQSKKIYGNVKKKR